MPPRFPFAVPFVRIAIHSHYQPGFHFGPRFLYDHCLIYNAAGEGDILIGNTIHRTLPDRLFLIPPRVVNEYWTTGQTAKTFVGVHFDWKSRPDTMQFQTFKPAEEPFEESLFRKPQFVPGWNLKEMPFLDLRGRPRVLRLLHEVVELYEASDEYSRAQAGAVLAAALIQMSREAQVQRDVLERPHLGGEAVRRAHRARALLETVTPGVLSVAQVAAEVGWGPEHLNRVCHSVFGASPQTLRTQARLRRARELLRYGNHSISEVAFACGYGDASHFARIFKKEIGVAPRDFLHAENTGNDKPNTP